MPHFVFASDPDGRRQRIVGGLWMRRDGVERPFLVHTHFDEQYEPRFFKIGIQHGRVVDVGPGTGGFHAVDGSRRFLETAPGAEFRDGLRRMRRMTDAELAECVRAHIPEDGLVRGYEHGPIPGEPRWADEPPPGPRPG